MWTRIVNFLRNNWRAILAVVVAILVIAFIALGSKFGWFGGGKEPYEVRLQENLYTMTFRTVGVGTEIERSKSSDITYTLERVYNDSFVATLRSDRTIPDAERTVFENALQEDIVLMLHGFKEGDINKFLDINSRDAITFKPGAIDHHTSLKVGKYDVRILRRVDVYSINVCDFANTTDMPDKTIYKVYNDEAKQHRKSLRENQGTEHALNNLRSTRNISAEQDLKVDALKMSMGVE